MLSVGLLLAGVAVVLFTFAQYQRTRLRQLRTAQRSTTRELAAIAESVSQALVEAGNYSQIAEVSGVVRCDAPLTSEVTKQSCVYYDAQVSREFEESRFGGGRRARRRSSRTRRGSETVSSNAQRVRFWVEDAFGRILVDPTGAEIEAIQTADRFESVELAGLGGSLKIGGFSLTLNLPTLGQEPGRRTLGYRYRERALPVGRRVYVIGEVSDASGELTVQRPRGKGRFLISLRSKDEIVRSATTQVRWLLTGSAGSGAVGAALVLLGLLGV